LDFAIGEFSRITGLSIKALRLYHEKEILVPSHIDPSSGYRYYDSAAVSKAKIIVNLRDMDFALVDIKDILNNYEDETNIVEALIRQKEKISEKIRRYRSVIQVLDDIINKERQAAISLEKNPMQVEERMLESVLVAGIRFKGRYPDIGEYFGKLADHLGDNISGIPLGLYYDGEYKEDNADLEACFPIREKRDIPGIHIRKLKAGRPVGIVPEFSHKDPQGVLFHNPMLRPVPGGIGMPGKNEIPRIFPGPCKKGLQLVPFLQHG